MSTLTSVKQKSICVHFIFPLTKQTYNQITHSSKGRSALPEWLWRLIALFSTQFHILIRRNKPKHIQYTDTIFFLCLSQGVSSEECAVESLKHTWAFLCVLRAKSVSCPPTAPWSAYAAPRLCAHKHNNFTSGDVEQHRIVSLRGNHWKEFQQGTRCILGFNGSHRQSLKLTAEPYRLWHISCVCTSEAAVCRG